MDIDLEQHQADLADTARRFFEARSTIGAVRGWEASEPGFAADLWTEMANLSQPPLIPVKKESSLALRGLPARY
jgi:hypothetical protein